MHKAKVILYPIVDDNSVDAGLTVFLLQLPYVEGQPKMWCIDICLSKSQGGERSEKLLLSPVDPAGNLPALANNWGFAEP